MCLLRLKTTCGELDRYGITELVGKDAFFNRINDVKSSYKRQLAVGVKE